MKYLFLSVAAFLLCISSLAQTVRGEWDLHYQAAIINDEFDVSNNVLASSGTLAAMNLSPYVGLRFGKEHRIKVGFNVMKDFGTPDTKPTTELAAWYQYDKKHFTLAAGIFPYSLLGGRYSSAIFSDAYRFYNVHGEGFLLNWHYTKSNYELAFDWCGKYGTTRREEFFVLSSGEGWVNPWLALCWEGVFHHYASSDAVHGVVDDHLIHPYIQFEFSSLLPVQRLELSLGGMAGYQMDRVSDLRQFPIGADVVAEIRKWNFGIRNHFYYGDSQMPFYHSADASGHEYGSSLYFRSTWWQIRGDGVRGMYDGLDLYWNKPLNKFVELGIHALFHFDSFGLLGSQQMFTCAVKLDQPKYKKK